MRALALAVFVCTLTVAPTAGAQPVRTCPDGQAVQSLEPGGKIVRCIPVSGDLGALNARIDAEAVARMAADQAIRDAALETGLGGRYAVVGIATCLRSPTGFGPGPNFAPNPGGTAQAQTITSNGIRTFNGDGTGTLVSSAHSINYPAPTFEGGLVSGNTTPVDATQSFTYTLDADRTIRIVTTSSNGVVHTAGGDFPTVLTESSARIGKVAKDWRTITLGTEELKVEISTTNGVPTQRVCSRIETMHKLAD